MAAASPFGYAPSVVAAMGLGYREDLSRDALTNLDPADTYFTKKCSRVDCSLRHDWLTDNLPTLPSTLPSGAPSATQQVGVVQLSTDWIFQTTLARKRYYNQTEYMYYPWKITQASERAAQQGFVAGGIESEIAEEIERAMKFFGKQMEFINLSAQVQAVDEDTQGTPANQIGLCSGFFDATTWNMNSAATPPLSWAASILPNLAAFNAFSQDNFEALLLQMHRNGAPGGGIDAYMPSGYQAAIASTWTGRPGYQVTQAVGEHAIDNFVHTYWSKCAIGRVDFISDRTIEASGCIALIAPAYVKLGEFIPFGSVREQPLNVSRNRQGVIDCQWTVIDRNPQAHGRVCTTGVTPGM
jgi:hypothetical protein